jgi:DNA replication and repair protein RecF
MTAGSAAVARPAASPRLAVRRLTLTDFRCYPAARLEADGRPVVLTGPNGAGKTNLLEAISFLAPGRGLRRARLEEATRVAAGEEAPPPDRRWAVAARLDTPQGEVAIGTGIDPAAPPGTLRRAVRIDGRPAHGQTDLADHVAMAWLTPQMDRLFVEGAGNRRRFFDRLVFGFHPGHAAALAAYEQAMRERSRLLKDNRFDDAWLSALEGAMAENGATAAASRREVAGRLAAAAAAVPEGAFPKAELAVTGLVEGWLDDRPALAAEDALRARLRDNRRADAAAGAATEGPHRSDLAVRHAGKGVPAGLCSTGEQKALLIGIVLANARLIAADFGAAPLLLLDEVAAHLDARRRAALFEAILALEAQAWLTGTDPHLFAAFGDRARHFTVEDATLSARDAPQAP